MSITNTTQDAARTAALASALDENAWSVRSTGRRLISGEIGARAWARSIASIITDHGAETAGSTIEDLRMIATLALVTHHDAEACHAALLRGIRSL